VDEDDPAIRSGGSVILVCLPLAIGVCMLEISTSFASFRTCISILNLAKGKHMFIE